MVVIINTLFIKSHYIKICKKIKSCNISNKTLTTTTTTKKQNQEKEIKKMKCNLVLVYIMYK